MIKSVLIIFVCLLFNELSAQKNTDSLAINQTGQDSILSEISVTAFRSISHWKKIPASIALIDSKNFQKYPPFSIIHAFNAVAGVRMEERSPGSYRFSIRGSLLRSPFGTRNVKVYWEDAPLTDAGGNTYLNLLDVHAISQVEMIKGPAASTYGAGTGGAILLHHQPAGIDSNLHQLKIGVSMGSNASWKESILWKVQLKNSEFQFQGSHQQSSGYREHSALKKYHLSAVGQYLQNKDRFKIAMFYTDLFYQTPGGITFSEMQLNPRLARQASALFPSAIEQKTSISNQTIFASLQHQHTWNAHWKSSLTLSKSYTNFINPFITNFETRAEQNVAGTAQLAYVSEKGWQLVTGFEWTQNQTKLANYGNRGGVKDTLQFHDLLKANQWYPYTILKYPVKANWLFQLGLSWNHQSYAYQPMLFSGNPMQTMGIDAPISPSLGISYSLNQAVNFYVTIAHGFSAPSLSEIRSNSQLTQIPLQAEYGWNYELGLKGGTLSKHWKYQVSVYSFGLKEAIVRRLNNAGLEFFSNAGQTQQIGAEAMLQHRINFLGKVLLKQFDLNASLAHQRYRFIHFQNGNQVYDGNRLTGVPKWTFSLSFDANFVNNYYLNTSLYCVSSVPLDDANTVYSKPHQLMQMKFGKYFGQHIQQHFFIGVDNLFNQLYSLGNDLNAAGKRYYNPAPNRNFYIGFVSIL